MSSTSDRKELLPFLSLSAFLLLLIPFLLMSEMFYGKGSGKQGMAETPKMLDRTLAELKDTQDVRQKKLGFFALLKPMVLLENSYILEQRRWIEALNLSQLTPVQSSQLNSILINYRLMDGSDSLPSDVSALRALVSRLLIRVQPVPVELVLVQAANESAWGRSRFAREGNNLFGQWCFSKGCGLVPNQRSEGAYHEVAVFKSPQLSIRAYLKNLNSFWAYEDFRQARAAEPELKGARLAIYLAEHLKRYSQRGQAYVDELKEMVQVNADLIEQAPDEYLR
ncbi:glucosaminidase domain-containing protein [Oceanospirillum linum]|nr:glucosaminidase domain-containing protein [Oceanospirillum linum]SEF52246.1 Bax protein [Oleiphilus messinensis]SMP04327.1 Bax protein [Oceanospirillum linum]